MKTETCKCDMCKEEFYQDELENFNNFGQLYCPECLPEVVDQYEEHQEYLSNQD